MDVGEPLNMNLHRADNLKSKSKAQVQVWADDWVFIRIGFSNQPLSQPAGKVSKKQNTAVYHKTKVVSIY